MEKEEVVVRFSGDSGDGMQLTGTLFSDTIALEGSNVSTFPDYPSEIRAPQGTVGGVSGFQVNFGNGDINNPGDQADVLVAMNPAAVKAHLKYVKPGGRLYMTVTVLLKKTLKRQDLKQMTPLKSVTFRIITLYRYR